MDSQPLLSRLVAGDLTAFGPALRSGDPVLMVAAALAVLDHAATLAETVPDRQVVAVAQAYLRGDTDRVGLLAKDHLAGYPDSPLVVHLAALAKDPS
jgi:hypothetical protein